MDSMCATADADKSEEAPGLRGGATNCDITYSCPSWTVGVASTEEDQVTSTKREIPTVRESIGMPQVHIPKNTCALHSAFFSNGAILEFPSKRYSVG